MAVEDESGTGETHMAGEQGEKLTAVIVAGGSGRRMGAAVPKQYLELDGVPVLVHTLRTFAGWELLDEIVLVTAEDQIRYCREQIIERYGIPKIRTVTAGGDERHESVYRGLLACEDADYVFIQDAVRPFVTVEILKRGWETVRRFGTAVCGVPAKDTVKIAGADGIVTQTPPRELVWMVQTPQIFRYQLIRDAYEAIRKTDRTGITDDAMVMEAGGQMPVHMFAGDYTNIKITTPDDLLTGEAILRKRHAEEQQAAEEQRTEACGS